MDTDLPDRESNSSRIVIGVLIMAFGLMMLAETTGLAHVDVDGRYWPFILLIIGLFRFLDPPGRGGRRGSRRSGAWLLYIGLWGLVSEFHVFGLDYSTSWPLMIVGVGLATIWRAVDAEEPRRLQRDDPR